MDLSKYAELFLSESREHLALINASLLDLERGEPAPGVVDGLFRSVHTIKGMSATMGYSGIAELSHHLESVLDGIRRGGVAVTPGTVQALFESADALEGAVEDAVAGGSDGGRITAALARLSALEEAAPAPDIRPSAGSAGDADELPLTTATAEYAVASSAGAERGGERRRARIDVRRLDALMDGIGELVITRGRLSHVAQRIGDEGLVDALAQLSRLVTELQDDMLASRMVAAAEIFERFPRFVRDAAHVSGKDVELIMRGGDIEVDRAVLDGISEPIVHLLRNAIDHGIESPTERLANGKPARGRIELSVSRDRAAVLIQVRDDGRGVDRDRVLERAREQGLVTPDITTLGDDEVFRLIARPGFTTAVSLTDLSGRGVGVDAVHARIRSLGGAVEFRTRGGAGTSVTLRLPLTVAIVRALLVRTAGETYAIPIAHVRETLSLEDSMLRSESGRDLVTLRDALVPLRRLRSVVQLPRDDAAERDLVVLDGADQPIALAVDDLVGQEDVVVKQFDPARDAVPLFGGATILADGAPALIFDVGSLV